MLRTHSEQPLPMWKALQRNTQGQGLGKKFDEFTESENSNYK